MPLRTASALLACLLLGSATQGWGHGSTRADIRLDVEPLPVPGLTLELHQDAFAPQLALANHSGKLLEIVDADGRPFLRIGPAGVAADHAAAAFYASLTPGGSPAPAKRLSATPDWQIISSEPAFGWFDPRLEFEHMEVPHRVRHAERPTAFGQWQIGATLEGKPLVLRGHFIFEPTPPGMAVARLTPPNLPQIEVTLVPGPKPAFFLVNHGPQLVEVLDVQHRPFLRIASDSVWADVGSPAFRAASSLVWGAETGWKKIADTGSATWLEPRAAYAGRAPARIVKAGRKVTLKRWTLPLRVGGKAAQLRGVVEWQPSPPSHR